MKSRLNALVCLHVIAPQLHTTQKLKCSYFKFTDNEGNGNTFQVSEVLE